MSQEDFQPGVYHGQRGVRNLPFWRHEYVVVVPAHKRGLTKETRKKMRKIGNREGVVLGAYNKKGKLKAQANQRHDTKSARKSALSGKNIKRVSDVRSNRDLNEAVRTSRGIKKDYPKLHKNIIGAADNSNTYARSLLKKMGYDTDVLKKSRLRNPGSTREMDLSALRERLISFQATRPAMQPSKVKYPEKYVDAVFPETSYKKPTKKLRRGFNGKLALGGGAAALGVAALRKKKKKIQYQ